MPDSDATRSSAHTRLCSTGSKCAIDQDAHTLPQAHTPCLMPKSRPICAILAAAQPIQPHDRIFDLTRNQSRPNRSARKAAKSSPRRRTVIMTSQQQPRMFHVKHIDFERSKTGFCAICLVYSCFSPHEAPAHLRAFRYITQSRSAQHRLLAIDRAPLRHEHHANARASKLNNIAAKPQPTTTAAKTPAPS